MALNAGARFGAYEISGPLGAGGMGEVYRAKDATLERDVALKLLPEAFAADANRVARFEQEAKTLAALNHPNIAQIFGLEKSGGMTAIVMELVEGTTLGERIAQGPIPADEALGIAYQIADALEAAHEKQIIHRDLKPANVKLTPKGTVKVLDFGIAKVLETRGISGPQAPSLTTPAMTQAGILLGTAAYMSPEQARGKTVDRRADIWAFGCLLYEMLTGQPAFGGEDVPITLARVLAHGTDMDSLPGVISPAVRHTIALCLEKDPKKRIADISDVRLALQGKFEPPLAQLAQHAVAQPLWRRVLPLAATAAVAAVVAALAVDWLATPPREVRRSIYTIPDDQQLNAPAGAPLLAVSPDGKAIAYAAGGAIYLRRLSELEGGPVSGTGGQSPVVPVFSPDGDWILYRSAAGRLERVPIEGGTPVTVVNESPLLGWRWDEDDIVRYSTNCQIKQVAATGGTPEILIDDGPNIGCVEPTLLAGTDNLLYEERPQTGAPEIVARSLVTDEKTPLFPGKQPLYVEPGYLVYFDVASGLMARGFDPVSLESGGAAAFVDDILVIGQVVHFRISASGTLVYLRGNRTTTGQGFLLSIAEEGGNIERLNLDYDDFRFPSVSPDGNQIAVQLTLATPQIFVYDLSGEREIRQLTYEGGQHPAWTPDGQWITYSSNRDGRWRIYRQRADGRGVPEALTDPKDDAAHRFPAWTPDGERLAYTETAVGGDDIWIVALPGGTPELLVGGDGNQTGIAFAPNGEALAYHTVFSSGSAAAEVIAEPLPRDGSRVRVSEDGVVSLWPVWSKKGVRLTYQILGGSFAAVDFDTQGFAIRNRRALPFNTDPGQRNLDSMPDGERMLLATPPFQGADDSPRELVIVENWIEEVKQRVPRE
jgi:serine/threonine-protein kinase